MLKKLALVVCLAATLAVSNRCTTAAPPPPHPAAPEDRFLVDPRAGWSGAAPTPRTQKLYDDAWTAFSAGNDAEARRLLDQIRIKQPDYAPAELAIAALDVRSGRLDEATAKIGTLAQKYPAYLAPKIYLAEIAARKNDLRRAYDLYSSLAKNPSIPDVSLERLSTIRRDLLGNILAAAQQAQAPQSIPLLREALTIDPTVRAARMALVAALIGQRNLDAAHNALEPLIATDADHADVQQALAEIEIGRGQYEQAIARYERLARHEKDPRYAARLEQIKEQWSAANMPPQYEKALESPSINRADLAVLMYWKVAAVRFAQNLPTPPIAVDIADVAGREEVIRAIAIGMLQVDPITRRVGPMSSVSPVQLSRYAARVLTSRGAACARNAGAEPSKVLAVCGVNDAAATLPPDSAVTGVIANGVAEQIDRALSAR